MRAIGLWMLLSCALALACGPASALDPQRDITQYKRTRWTSDEGAPIISALAQGHDGYLWVGARDGLFRFDGIRFEPIAPERRIGQRSLIQALLTASDGSIWAGYRAGGVAVYRDGVLRDAGLPVSTAQIVRLSQTGDGAIWAHLGRLDLPLARYHAGRWQEIGVNWGLPREFVFSTLAARDGSLWVTTGQSVMRLPRGAVRFVRQPQIPDGHAALSEDHHGRIWLSDRSGTRMIAGSGAATPARRSFAYPSPDFPRATRTFFDRDGNLWGIPGRAGVFRVRAPDGSGAVSRLAAVAAVEFYREENGLISNGANAIMEDREGDIWIGSVLGLERLRRADVVAEPALRKVATWGFTLLGASDGSIFVGQADSVYRVAPGGRPIPVLENVAETEAICEGPSGTVWIVLTDGLVRLQDGRSVRSARPQVGEEGVFDCAVDGQGNLWLSAMRGGIFVSGPRGWRRLETPPSVSGPQTMIRDRDGSVIVQNGGESLLRMTLGGLTVLQPHPSNALDGLSALYRGEADLFIAGEFGLARWRDDRFAAISPDRVAAFAAPSGIVETPEGETWLIATNGIVRMRTVDLARAFADASARLAVTVFDVRDGLPGVHVRDGKRDAVRGGDGRLWFATTAGVVWVDPSQLTTNPVAPPVVISAIRARGLTYRDPRILTLPAGTSSVAIDYAALSLSVPERVRVLYRLDGVDAAWTDPGLRRQSFYTNLAPGTYRFHVIAANDKAVWNRTGATLEFTIPPTFLQSLWFKLMCILPVLALLFAGYRLQMRRVAAQLQARMQVRVAERERIARELHDTLLQGFQGLMLRFQAVADRIPPDQPLRPILEDALDRADAVLVEGRDRVRDLRNAAAPGDLAEALVDFTAGIARESTIRLDLAVEGRARDLKPTVREEVQRIGEEAIRNAVVHSGATTVKVALAYRRTGLRLDVRDDGAGLPAEVVAAGRRDGHFGLQGMRERAAGIGGTLSVVSREGAGVEVLLSIPGRAAYVGRLNRWLFWKD